MNTLTGVFCICRLVRNDSAGQHPTYPRNKLAVISRLTSSRQRRRPIGKIPLMPARNRLCDLLLERRGLELAFFFNVDKRRLDQNRRNIGRL